MKNWMLSTLVVTSFLASGCAMTSYYHCRKWQDDGSITSTIDSCQRCVDTFGSGNLDMIRGCAIGMDAAVLIEAQKMQNQSAAPLPRNGAADEFR